MAKVVEVEAGNFRALAGPLPQFVVVDSAEDSLAREASASQLAEASHCFWVHTVYDAGFIDVKLNPTRATPATRVAWIQRCPPECLEPE